MPFPQGRPLHGIWHWSRELMPSLERHSPKCKEGEAAVKCDQWFLENYQLGESNYLP